MEHPKFEDMLVHPELYSYSGRIRKHEWIALKEQIVRDGEIRGEIEYFEMGGKFWICNGMNRRTMWEEEGLPNLGVKEPKNLHRLEFDSTKDEDLSEVKAWIAERVVGQRNISKRRQKMHIGQMVSWESNAKNGKRKTEYLKEMCRILNLDIKTVRKLPKFHDGCMAILRMAGVGELDRFLEGKGFLRDEDIESLASQPEEKMEAYYQSKIASRRAKKASKNRKDIKTAPGHKKRGLSVYKSTKQPKFVARTCLLIIETLMDQLTVLSRFSRFNAEDHVPLLMPMQVEVEEVYKELLEWEREDKKNAGRASNPQEAPS